MLPQNHDFAFSRPRVLLAADTPGKGAFSCRFFHLPHELRDLCLVAGLQTNVPLKSLEAGLLWIEHARRNNTASGILSPVVLVSFCGFCFGVGHVQAFS